MDPQVTLSLTSVEATIVLRALGKLRFNQVGALPYKIEAQLRKQLPSLAQQQQQQQPAEVPTQVNGADAGAPSVGLAAGH